MTAEPLSHVARHRRAQHPHPVDVHVGARMRMRRTALGMSQEKLGEALGLTFQQVQKYERAANRVGASRLYELSRVLGVPVGYFFDEFDPALLDGGVPVMGEPPRAPYDAAALDRDQVEIVKVFHRIGDAAVRRHIVDLVKSIGTAYFGGEEA